MNLKLRVAIDCRIGDPHQGIGTAVLALAKALSDSKTANQEYTFVVREEIREWLAPYVYGPCSLKGIPSASQPPPPRSFIRSTVARVGPLRAIWRKLHKQTRHVPKSDGFVESQRFDVVHFPTQMAYLTELPSIYQPWDLQHLHYPQFFSESEFARRELEYRTFCESAACVCVQAEWTKRDIVNHYKIASEKVAVIPWGSVFDAYENPSAEEVRAATEKFNLPDHFFFYPAVTWPHKNHEIILRALHILKRDYGVAPQVLFTKSSADRRADLDKLARDLGVQKQVRFLGFVTPGELQAVFNAATAMIFPSKFEGFGLPILEAFHACLPVLSSNATTLPEVGRDGALYFDPDSAAELSALMRAILDNPNLRDDMIQKGGHVLSQHSMHETAAGFQTLYDKIATLNRRIGK